MWGSGGRVFGIIMPNRAVIFLLRLSSGGHVQKQEPILLFLSATKTDKLSHKPHGERKRNIIDQSF